MSAQFHLVTKPTLLQEVIDSAGEPIDRCTRRSLEAGLDQPMTRVSRRFGDKPGALWMSAPGGRCEREPERLAKRAACRGQSRKRARHDFSDVRIHVDARAAALAEAFHARAFAFGKHIVFAANEYAPDSTAGRRLLSHELAHVLQQRGG